MKRGWTKRVGWMVAVGVLTAVAWPAQGRAAPAQQSDAECRCVDADDNPIDDCTCFRMPRFEMAFAPGGRPRLGVSVDSDQSSTLDAQGAEVTRVLEDGPAAESGLEVGDIITRIDGQSLLQPLAADVEEDFDLDESLPVQRLLSIARQLEPGQQVEIAYLRGGEPRTATVEARELSMRSFAYALESFDAERMQADAERMREQMRDLRDSMRDLDLRFDGSGGSGVRVYGGGDWPFVIGPLGSSRYGLQLVELNEELGGYFGVSEGVLVAEVDDDSEIGLRPGDVILGIGDREVATPNRVLRLLGTYEDDEEISFRIRRNGAEMSVMGRLGG